MVVVITVLAALFVGGAYALYLQVQDTRAAGYVSRERQALYCAEAGLVATRQYVAANRPLWDAMLDPERQNPPNYPVEGDLTGDGEIDFVGTVKDNLDGDSNPHSDNDMSLYVIAQCTQFEDSPREVRELLEFAPIGHDFSNQAGHGGAGAGNTN